MISERRIYAQRDVQQFGGRKFTVARLLGKSPVVVGFRALG